MLPFQNNVPNKSSYVLRDIACNLLSPDELFVALSERCGITFSPVCMYLIIRWSNKKKKKGFKAIWLLPVSEKNCLLTFPETTTRNTRVSVGKIVHYNSILLLL
jgi:hypothetical protein